MDEKFILNEMKLGYTSKVKPSERVCIKSSKDIYNTLLSIWPDIELCESFAMICLNRANKILGINFISKGGTSGTVIDLKLIASTAILSNSSSVIIVHNHPSGNTKPSDSDRSITNKIKNALELFEIKLLDHIIITNEGYYSFVDEGMLN